MMDVRRRLMEQAKGGGVMDYTQIAWIQSDGYAYLKIIFQKV